MQEISLGKKKRQNFNPLSLSVAAASIIVAALILFLGPSFLQQPINTTGKPKIYFMGKDVSQNALYKDETAYIPLEFIKSSLDPIIQYDSGNAMVIITTPKNVFHFPLGAKTGLANLEPYTFTYPVIEEDNKIFLPLNPLKEYYGLEVKDDRDQMILRIYDLNQPHQEGKVIKNTKLRQRSALRSPWTAEVAVGEMVKVLREEDNWYWVESEDGRMGYIFESYLTLTDIKTTEIKKEVYQPWNPIGKPVILTWEQAGRTTVNPYQLKGLEGVQIVSPTWFHLQKEGLVVNNADIRYVKWAHDQGRQVWGLFDNGFDPDLTHAFLNDANLRINAIRQLLSYVDLYKLDGINIDFENMYLKDKDAFTQFVRELAPLLHEKERTLSVDVTFHSTSETWSMCYDRVNLAKAADYLMVMAYDEHGGSGKNAGSTASLPWVERGIIRMLEEVPEEKLILGIPFYTRLWTEETDTNGKKSVTSKAFSMKKAEEWIKEKNASIVYDEKTGQNYVQVSEGNIINKMWLEDEISMKKRIELMKKYRLAGIAAWRRGLEKEETWAVINAIADSRM